MKKTTFLVLASVFFLLSSCIPSLHSIVDEENRVTDDRLIGDWKVADNAKISVTNFSVTSDDKEDQKEGERLLQEFMDSINNAHNYSLWKFERAAKLKFEYSTLPEGTLSWTQEAIGGAESTLGRLKKQYKNDNIIISQQEELPYYVLTHEEADIPGSRVEMIVNLTKINGDLYMDIYPKEVNGIVGRFEDNFIGAHTFAKLEFKGNKWLMYHFDVDELKRLIKSKRVRLKHEIITTPVQEKNKIVYEDNFILTASMEELRAFLTKYGNDESLYAEIEELTQ